MFNKVGCIIVDVVTFLLGDIYLSLMDEVLVVSAL